MIVAVDVYVIIGFVQVGNPTECLLRRGDVVTFRAETNDGRAYIAQID